MKCRMYVIVLIMAALLCCASTKEQQGITIYYNSLNPTKEFHRDYPNLQFLYRSFRCDDPSFGYHHFYLMLDGRVMKVTFKGNQAQVWKVLVRQPYPHENPKGAAIAHIIHNTIIDGTDAYCTEIIQYEDRLSFDLSTRQGGSRFIMNTVKCHLILQKCPPEEIEQYINQCKLGNYDHLLQVSKDILDKYHIDYVFYYSER